MTAAVQIPGEAGGKLASGFLASKRPARAWTPAVQSLGTHQENAVFHWETASGCAVAPNRTATIVYPGSEAQASADAARIADLIRRAGIITRRMNETLSDANVIEGNIRLGEAVSTAHMVLDEGIALGAVAAKSVSVLRGVGTLGGYIVRGPGTLGVGGRVAGGVAGTAAGDIINASIRDQQIRTVGGAIVSEAVSTGGGALATYGAKRISAEVQDALGSGRGAVNEAYKASGALYRSYFDDAARLKAIREELRRLGAIPGGNGG